MEGTDQDVDEGERREKREDKRKGGGKGGWEGAPLPVCRLFPIRKEQTDRAFENLGAKESYDLAICLMKIDALGNLLEFGEIWSR